mmetsp:Transcript_16679/g.51781  ORF Transcript_16679/g.51781 Transcript_16679/m.51781 type:complete len:276 (-) Transcript_16679:3024-3851(-)
MHAGRGDDRARDARAAAGPLVDRRVPPVGHRLPAPRHPHHVHAEHDGTLPPDCRPRLHDARHGGRPLPVQGAVRVPLGVHRFGYVLQRERGGTHDARRRRLQHCAEAVAVLPRRSGARRGGRVRAARDPPRDRCDRPAPGARPVPALDAVPAAVAEQGRAAVGALRQRSALLHARQGEQEALRRRGDVQRRLAHHRARLLAHDGDPRIALDHDRRPAAGRVARVPRQRAVRGPRPGGVHPLGDVQPHVVGNRPVGVHVRPARGCLRPQQPPLRAR